MVAHARIVLEQHAERERLELLGWRQERDRSVVPRISVWPRRGCKAARHEKTHRSQTHDGIVAAEARRHILFGDQRAALRYLLFMGTLLRLFGNARARDFAGWMLEASTQVLVTVQVDDAFGGAALELAPMSPAEAALAIERLTSTGLRLAVAVQQRYVPFREIRNTLAYVDDVSPADLERIAAEMIRSGVPVVSAPTAVTRPPVT